MGNIFGKLDNEYGQDTGWVTLTPSNTDFSQWTDSSQIWQIRRYNQFVQMRGALTTKAGIIIEAVAGDVVATLASNFRPTDQRITSVNQGSNAFRFLLVIELDGRVRIGRYANHQTSAYDTAAGCNIPNGVWLRMDANWLV